MAVNKVVYNGQTLIDTSNDTVAPNTLLKGITAHDKSGSVITGTYEGEDWGRPEGCPDLSQMDISENCVYLSYDNRDKKRNYIYMTVSPACTLEIGEIVNGNFNVLATETMNSNVECVRKFDDIDSDFVICRIKGFAYLYTSGNNKVDKDGFTFRSVLQNLIQVYGNADYGYLGINFNSCAFVKCIELRNVVVRRTAMFEECNSLRSLKMPNPDTSQLTDLYYMFAGTILRRIDLSDWDLSKVNRLMGAFMNCPNLESVNFGDTLDSSKITSYTNVFYNDSVLDIDISQFDFSGVTKVSDALNVISQNKVVTEVTIPETMKFIGGNAFGQTTHCFEYHVKSAEPPTLGNTNAFHMKNGMKIYVPAGSLTAYQSATNWSGLSQYLEEE